MAVCPKCGNYYNTKTCIYCSNEPASMVADNGSIVNEPASMVADDGSIVNDAESRSADNGGPMSAPDKKNTNKIVYREFETIAIKNTSATARFIRITVICSIFAMFLITIAFYLAFNHSSLPIGAIAIILFILLIFLCIFVPSVLYATIQYFKTPSILVESDGLTLNFFSGYKYRRFQLNEVTNIEFRLTQTKQQEPLRTGYLAITADSRPYIVHFVDEVADAHAKLTEVLRVFRSTRPTTAYKPYTPAEWVE